MCLVALRVMRMVRIESPRVLVAVGGIFRRLIVILLSVLMQIYLDLLWWLSDAHINLVEVRGGHAIWCWHRFEDTVHSNLMPTAYDVDI